MLRFTEKPDEIFLTILHEAINEELGYFQNCIDDIGFFEASYPLSSRHFSLTLAAQTLQRLRMASEAEELYQLTDFHWELLYEVLRGYSAAFNDDAVESEVLEKYGIKEIDFSGLIEMFFWDTDFMQDAETMLELTVEQKETLGMSNEAFGMAQGLSPHPEELELRPVPKDEEMQRIGDCSPRPPSSMYP